MGTLLSLYGRRSVFTPKYIIAFLASRARLRVCVGDVIKVRCHRNHHPGALTPTNTHEPLITPVIALGWHPPVVRAMPGSSLTLSVRRTYTYLDSWSANCNLFLNQKVPLLLLLTKRGF
jgi:hypothetical protein